MDETQFAEAAKDKIEWRDVQVRQISNGFVLIGNRRFVFPTTLAIAMQQTTEGVATTGEAASAMVASFLLSGSF
jgi:hypothetical protein